MPTIVLVTGLAAALLALEIFTHRRVRRALAPRPAPPRLPIYPSVTVIRPIKGLDPEAAENLRAALDVAYPGSLQTLFVFDHEREPALPLARAALAAHQRSGGNGSAEILFCGPPPKGRTGKLNAMIQGLQKATGELIAFADSDIRTDPTALRVLVETLRAAPRAGSAFAPVAVSGPPHSFGDTCCALLLNGLYTPAAASLTLRSDGELPFILGQFMVLSREAIDAIGGLEAVQGQFVDDLYIGQLVRAAGLRNVASTHPIRIIQHGLDARTALAASTRWFAFSRTGIPDWSFKGRIAVRAASFWLGGLGALGFTLAGHAIPALLFAALAAYVNWSVGWLATRAGGAPLRGIHRLAPGFIYLVAPFVLLYASLERHVRWRGREYTLDTSGRLAALTSELDAPDAPPGSPRSERS